MKTIGFQDNKGGSIYCYFRKGQTRFERIKAALNDLKRTGNITIYYVKGNKVRQLFTK